MFLFSTLEGTIYYRPPADRSISMLYNTCKLLFYILTDLKSSKIIYQSTWYIFSFQSLIVRFPVLLRSPQAFISLLITSSEPPALPFTILLHNTKYFFFQKKQKNSLEILHHLYEHLEF